MTDLYDAFPGLTIDRPADGLLRVTMDGPGLNAVGPDVQGPHTCSVEQPGDAAVARGAQYAGRRREDDR